MARRLLLLVALLMGLTALAASIAPRDSSVESPPSATPQGAARTAPAPAESGRRVTGRIAIEDGDKPERLVARVGNTVELTVTGNVLDAVQIVTLDQVEPIDPGTPARFEFIAENPGTHAIELVENRRVIGELRIDD